MSRIIGIDLGTTRSAVAVVNEYGRPEILPNREGGRVTPSVVMFDGDSPVVGEIALTSAVVRPLDTVQFVKRQMGEREWSYRSPSGQSYSPEDISAIILKRLKDDAEEKLGESITKAVISVPAYFDDAGRSATIDAAKIAGLEVERLLNEPTAAALAYGLDAQSNETVLVYDLGGGTFDVTIMKLSGGDFTVLATDGDRQLGGFDWDNLVMEWLNEQFKAAGGPSLINEPESEQMLRDHAVRAKHTLSTRDESNVFLAFKGFSEKISISRQKFDEITAPLLNRTARLVEKTLEDAGLSWSGIDKTILVGGSTRMRQVTDLVERLSGERPSNEANPDEVVALGAAIQAALLSGNSGGPQIPIVTAAGDRLTSVNIQDVTAHSLGVVCMIQNPQTGDWGEINSIIIPKGTQIPCQLSESYQTMQPNQTEWECQVTEGEDFDLRYVRIVGTGSIRLPGTAPAGTEMLVALSYTADGIVNVFAHEATGRLIGELRIDRTSNMSDREVDQSRRRMEDTEVS
jgi:molecular chaperone DnaK